MIHEPLPSHVGDASAGRDEADPQLSYAEVAAFAHSDAAPALLVLWASNVAGDIRDLTGARGGRVKTFVLEFGNDVSDDVEFTVDLDLDPCTVAVSYNYDGGGNSDDAEEAIVALVQSWGCGGVYLGNCMSGGLGTYNAILNALPGGLMAITVDLGPSVEFGDTVETLADNEAWRALVAKVMSYADAVRDVPLELAFARAIGSKAYDLTDVEGSDVDAARYHPDVKKAAALLRRRDYDREIAHTSSDGILSCDTSSLSTSTSGTRVAILHDDARAAGCGQRVRLREPLRWGGVDFLFTTLL